jgi:hypothetical protein
LTNKTPVRSSVNAANLAFVVLLFLVLGCSCQKLGETLSQKKENPPEPQSNSTPPTKDLEDSTGDYDLTLAKYNRIKIDQPRSEVEDILGGEGTLVSSNSGGGMKFTVNKWDGSDYRSIILSFKNDRVMTKSQVGLK